MRYKVQSFVHIFAIDNTKENTSIMNIENTKAQMRKGILEFCILSILKRKDCYTSEILEELKSVKLVVVEGTVYPLLTRLKNDDLLIYRWEESNAGPPRKYYELTEKGNQFLIELGKTWTTLSEAVDKITSNNINHE
ncbi:transcriptional regulator, PadR family [Myroides guanonis]|uniref:Transcriptional regulator, PadR family n=2 Tax=Myroides guanonis TaxID=1150112 RepID=A0A1I3P8C1_9FLAO|nr:transcriptional regulator, PadR family [Myroides guanonis]